MNGISITALKPEAFQENFAPRPVEALDGLKAPAFGGGGGEPAPNVPASKASIRSMTDFQFRPPQWSALND